MSHHTQPSDTDTPVDKYSRLVEAIYTSLNEHLMILMNQMLKTAGDKLFDLSEKAESNEQQMLYLDTIRLINDQRSTISNQFFVSLNNSPGKQMNRCQAGTLTN